MDQALFRARKSGRRTIDRYTRWGLKTLAVAVVGGLIAAAIPGTAQAAGVVSQGEGRLLTASLGASTLDALASVDGAVAVDQFGLGDQVSDVAISLTALNALNVRVP
ncbi:MAG: hypothetical protein JWO10_347, partial [Microbacteriaceae bacterium]|nr:hypothetical protein [Microbacteriaceae bacterium]